MKHQGCVLQRYFWWTGRGRLEAGRPAGEIRHADDGNNRETAQTRVGCGLRALGRQEHQGSREASRCVLSTWQGPCLSATRQAKPVPTTKDSTSSLANKREDGVDYVIFKTSPHNACNFLS